jgi:murein L,D-transpeptidase YafK
VRRAAHWLAWLCLALACARPAPPPPAPAPAPIPPPAACQEVERLTVYKSERRLVAACRGGGERVFPVSLSREPVGAKRVQGDRRVPEGEYRVAGAARPSRFHLFLPIDYPSPADAERALAEGRITRAERDAIARAHAAGALPPHDTALGGRLGIHGEGARWRGDLDLDWTEGCVAVTDAAIDWLAVAAPPGTPVVILP